LMTLVTVSAVLLPGPRAKAQQVSTSQGAAQSEPDTQSRPNFMYEWWNEVIAPSKRGEAISSPVDSPDGYEPRVGGTPLVVPYYSGFGLDMWSGINPARYRPSGSEGIPSGPEPKVSPRSHDNYGSYTGGNRDEVYLLHLGGSGPSAEYPGAQPHRRTRDIIDQINEAEVRGKDLRSGFSLNVHPSFGDQPRASGVVPSSGTSGPSQGQPQR
jgi:hypothetical protein